MLGKSTRSLLILVIDKIQKLNPETSLAESGVASIPPRASRILILFCLSTSFFGLGFQRPSPESISHSPRIRTRDNGLSDTRLAVVPTSRPINYIVIVVMENRNYADIIGNPSTPYTNRLANDYGVSSNYYDVSSYLSLPNYLALVSGNPHDSWALCNAPPHACRGWSPVPDSTITDRIEAAGMTWKAYMEDMPNNCYQYNSAGYVPRHNPFVYFAHVLNTTSECNRVVPAGTKASNLISDLASTTTASNFLWLTPNLCNDMHDCPTSVGDNYLSQVIPQILNSPVFRTQKAALFLTWDEGSNSAHIPALWAGPAVRQNYTSSISYNHYSLLKTIETVWNLPPLTPNDARALAMTEFLAGASPSLRYTPSQPGPDQIIIFNGSATGGASPYSFNWSFGDGGTSTGANTTHAYTTSGSYNVTLAVSDWLNHTSFKFTTVNVSDFTIAASYLVTPVLAGVSATSTITLRSHYGFTGTIVLSANASASWVNAALNPNQVILPSDRTANSTLTFTSNIPGTYTITVHATSGSASQTITQTFRIDSHTPSPANTISSTTILGFSSNQLFTMALITAVSASATVFVGRRSRRPRPT